MNLYRSWAETYDHEFAASHGYVYPREVARLYAETGRAGAVLDIGAGTGLVGAAMAGATIDGIDISQEMLDVAAAKAVYRTLICADLTQPLDLADASYDGFVSAGTFTHGHVGPVCLTELMRLARPGAVFALGINAQVFDEARFGSAFARLVAADKITPLHFREVPIYEGADHAHVDDKSLVAVFHRTGA